jgi:hypothetical protein
VCHLKKFYGVGKEKMNIVDWWTDWQGNPKYSVGNVYNATLLTTNPTQTGMELNQGLCNERPATNSLSYQNSYQLLNSTNDI